MKIKQLSWEIILNFLPGSWIDQVKVYARVINEREKYCEVYTIFDVWNISNCAKDERKLSYFMHKKVYAENASIFGSILMSTGSN